jgi:hypothetical protein
MVRGGFHAYALPYSPSPIADSSFTERQQAGRLLLVPAMWSLD